MRGAHNLPMAGRCDEVEADVDAIVTEPRVALDSGFFRKDFIVLPLQVSHDFLKATRHLSLAPEKIRTIQIMLYLASLSI